MQVFNDYYVRLFFKIIFWISFPSACLFLAFWGIVTYANYEGQKRMRKDEQHYCQDFEYINEPLHVFLKDFTATNIDTLSCFLIRKKAIIKDSSIKTTMAGCRIYLGKFLRTDTIAILTRNKQIFYLSDFDYKFDAHFGNMGYISTSCRVSEICKINGNTKNMMHISTKNGTLKWIK